MFIGTFTARKLAHICLHGIRAVMVRVTIHGVEMISPIERMWSIVSKPCGIDALDQALRLVRLFWYITVDGTSSSSSMISRISRSSCHVAFRVRSGRLSVAVVGLVVPDDAMVGGTPVVDSFHALRYRPWTFPGMVESVQWIRIHVWRLRPWNYNVSVSPIEYDLLVLRKAVEVSKARKSTAAGAAGADLAVVR